MLLLLANVTKGNNTDKDIYVDMLLDMNVEELFELAETFHQQEQRDNELLCFLAIIEKTQNQTKKSTLRQRALAMVKAGIIYYSYGDFIQSLRLFHESLSLYESLNDKDGIANLLNNLGTVYHKWGDYDEALRYYNLSMHKFDSLGLYHSLTITYNNIGAVHILLGNYEEGLELFEQSLKLQEERENSEAINLLNNIGVVYMELDKTEQAMSNYRRALRLAKAENNTEYQVISLMNIANAMILEGDDNSALEYLLQAKPIAEDGKHRNRLSAIYRSLSSIHQRLNNDTLALAYYSMYLTEYEYLFNLGKHQTLREIQILHQTEQKNNTIRMLTKEKEIQKNRIRSQKIILTSFTVLGIMVLLFVSVFGFQKVVERRSYNHLLDKNLEVVEAESKNQRKISLLEARINSITELEKEVVQTSKVLIDHIDSHKQLPISNSSDLLLLNKSKTLFRKLCTVLQPSTSTTFFGATVNPPPQPENLSFVKFPTKQLAENIKEVMRTEKPYLQADFSLDKLSVLASSNKKYVSFVINEEFEKGFNHFVNEYRIKTARKMLTDQRYQHYTIEAIANMVGFKSKSSFNSAFKLFTGLTPSYYKRASKLALFKQKKAIKAEATYL